MRWVRTYARDWGGGGREQWRECGVRISAGQGVEGWGALWERTAHKGTWAQPTQPHRGTSVTLVPHLLPSHRVEGHISNAQPTPAAQPQATLECALQCAKTRRAQIPPRLVKADEASRRRRQREKAAGEETRDAARWRRDRVEMEADRVETETDRVETETDSRDGDRQSRDGDRQSRDGDRQKPGTYKAETSRQQGGRLHLQGRDFQAAGREARSGTH